MSPGRPPLPPEQKRTIQKSVAFSEDEYDRLCRVALVMRMNVNEFIRLMAVPDHVTSGFGCVINTDSR